MKSHLQIACRRGGTRREVVGHREYLVRGIVCRRRVAARGNQVAHLVARGWVGLVVVLEFDMDGQVLLEKLSEAGGSGSQFVAKAGSQFLAKAGGEKGIMRE